MLKSLLCLLLLVGCVAYADDAREGIFPNEGNLDSFFGLKAIDEGNIALGGIRVKMFKDEDGIRNCVVGIENEGGKVLLIHLWETKYLGGLVYYKKVVCDGDYVLCDEADLNPCARGGELRYILSNRATGEKNDKYSLSVKKSDLPRPASAPSIRNIPFSEEFITCAVRGTRWLCDKLGITSNAKQPFIFNSAENDEEDCIVMNPWGETKLLILLRKFPDMESVHVVVSSITEEYFSEWNIVRKDGNISCIEYSRSENFFWVDEDGDGIPESAFAYNFEFPPKPNPTYDVIVEKRFVNNAEDGEKKN